MIQIQYHELKLVEKYAPNSLNSICKNLTHFEMLKGVKHSSLLSQRLNYTINMFYDIGPGLVSSTGFCFSGVFLFIY